MVFSELTTKIMDSSNPILVEPIVLLSLVGFTIWAGIYDIKTLKIKNKFNTVFFLTGLSFMLMYLIGLKVDLPAIMPTLSFGWSNVGGLVGGFLFIFVPAFIKNHPMGGDIKMSAIMGFWMGFTPVVFVLFIATIFNLLYWAGAFYIWKDYGSKTLMPFAPFFALGVLVFYGLGYFL